MTGRMSFRWLRLPMASLYFLAAPLWRLSKLRFSTLRLFSIILICSGSLRLLVMTILTFIETLIFVFTLSESFFVFLMPFMAFEDLSYVIN